MDLENIIAKDHLARVEVDPKAAESELSIARSDLEAAENEVKTGKPRWVVVKAYYAMFHSARAVLLMMGLKERRHYAIREVLKHLTYKGKLEQKYVDVFHSAMEAREEADYELSNEPVNTQAVVKTATEFIKEMERQVKRLSQIPK